MNIVTIDFDIIMQPSINIYNNLIDDDFDWDDLFEYPELRLVRADMNIYKKITNYIFKCFFSMNKDNIYFIDDHSQVIHYIDSPVNLINIDHHHDTGYDNKKFNILLSNEIDSGNWVKWLYQQKLIQKYIWIKNNNSDDDSLNEKIIQNDNIIELQKYDFQSLIIPDKLILCLSTPWVAPNYYPLFDLWKDYYKQIFKVSSVPMLEGPYKI